MRTSVKLYFNGPVGAIGVAVSGLMTAIGFAEGVNGDSFWMWLFFAAVALVIVSFWRFHEQRVQADQERKAAIRYALEFVGLGGGPAQGLVDGTPAQGYRLWLLFRNRSSDPLRLQVEQCSITVGDHAADPDREWLSTTGIVAGGAEYDFAYHWITAPIDKLPLGEGEYTVLHSDPSGQPAFRATHSFFIEWRIEGGEAVPIYRTKDIAYEDVS